jgi:hypothetical protein
VRNVPAAGTGSRAPSLEDILWRAMDRFREEPALLDVEEFAEHIAHAFEAEVPEEAFAARFFAGPERLHRRRASLAQAVVRASPQRLHVYEFDLDQLEYVIVEDGDGAVVVSDFGQFRLQDDGTLGRALEAAVVKRAEPGAGEPRAWLVRAGGEVVAVEVGKVARTLERLTLRQVSMPAVHGPGRRLASFRPARRELSEEGELRALEQNPDLAAAIAQRWSAGAIGARTSGPRRRAQAGGAELSLQGPGTPFPGIPSGWEEMLGDYAQPAGRTFAVQTSQALVLVAAAPRRTPGERALAGSEMLDAVRRGDAPVRALGGPRAAGPFVAAAQATEARPDFFWVQPERIFLPEAAAEERTVVAHPLRLGQITGDPWADWALAVGGARSAAPRGELGSAPLAVTPLPMAGAGEDLPPADVSVLAFRAPDGALIVHPPRLAPIAPAHATAVGLRARAGLASRSGALPVATLRALHLALERTAAAGGYRLPVGRLGSSPHAIPLGKALQLPSGDVRRRSVRLAAPVSLRDHTARLLLSIPFPDRGQLHVGEDLSDALHAYLAAPVMPLAQAAAVPSSEASSIGALVAAPREQAIRSARQAVAALEAPGVKPLLAATTALSALPVLLQRALAATASWTTGPGAPMPLAVRVVAERAPFAPPPAVSRRSPRPLGPGEEEIVIPLPLWAQMGQSTISDPGALLVAAAPEPAVSAPQRWAVAADPEVEAARVVAPQPARPVDLGPATPRWSAQPEAGAGALAREESPPQFPPPAAGRGPAAGPVVAPPVGSGRRSASIPELHRSGLPSPARPSEVWRALSAGDLAASPAGMPSGRPPDRELVTGGGFESPATRSIASAPSSGAGVAGTSSSGRYTPFPSTPAVVAAPAEAASLAWRQPAGPLRFRYPGAPLWWSSRSAAAFRADGGASPLATGALRAGLGAANTAAAIWRSILVAGAEPDGRGTGSIDAVLPGGLGSLAAGPQARVSLAVPAPSTANAAVPAFIAVTSSGAAGTVPAAGAVPAAAAARVQAIEMSIVAAIPPAPPPLAAMSSAAPVGGAPQARGRGMDAAVRGQQREVEDAFAHSKIEGSVDAIAQRIYHRIRRRLQSDRERFGG